MSLKNIETLSLNPHFFKQLLHCFLTGYGKPCDIHLLFMVLPILLYEPSRTKLSTATIRSSLSSLFTGKQEIAPNINISEKTSLAGFLSRHEILKESTKKSIIILHSEHKIAITNNSIIANQNLTYTTYNSTSKSWFKAAHYLGVIFSKASIDHIYYFLGVE